MYLLKIYNDENPYQDEDLYLFYKKESAIADFQKVAIEFFKDYIGEDIKSYSELILAVEKYKDGFDENDFFEDDYIQFDTGDGYLFMSVEELKPEDKPDHHAVHNVLNDHEEIFSYKIWRTEDIAATLEEEGYKASQENIALILNESHLDEMLHDCNDYDWGCFDAAFNEVKDELEKEDN